MPSIRKINSNFYFLLLEFLNGFVKTFFELTKYLLIKNNVFLNQICVYKNLSYYNYYSL